MSRSTLACCLWGAATITAAAAAAVVQASMVNRRIDATYIAMARAFITRPSYEDPAAAPEPGRHLRPVH